MTDNSTALDGLLAALASPEHSWSHAVIMTTLQQSKHAARQISDAVSVHRKSENLIVRGSAYTAIGWLVSRHPEVQPKLIPMLIEALEVLTAKLHGKTYNGKQQAISLLAEFEDPSPETVAALVEHTKFESKRPYNAERNAKQGFKQSALQTLRKIAPETQPAGK